MSSDTPARKRLLLFPQDKGGIGKSFVAALLHDFLAEAGVQLKAFDLDHANSTLNRLVPSAEFINTDVDSDRLAVLDRVIEAFEEADTVLVDNRASGGNKVLAYLEEAQLPELQRDLGLRIVFVVVATDDKDANSQIVDLLDTHAERVSWLVAKNHRDSDALAIYQRSRARERLLGLGAAEVDVPCLANLTRNRLQQHNLTIGRGRTAEQLHLLDRSRCVRYHATMRGQFEAARHLLIG
jgi:hypothetical protein